AARFVIVQAVVVSERNDHARIEISQEIAARSLEEHSVADFVQVNRGMGRVRQSTALVPGNSNWPAPIVSRNVEMSFQFYWSHFWIEWIAFAFSRRRQAGIDRVPGQVHRMAAHVTHLATAEIPMHVPVKASALEVFRVVGMKRRRPQP